MKNRPPVLSAILLAAGLSSRMGTDKLLLEYKGLPLFQHSLDLLGKLPVNKRILVTTEARLAGVFIHKSVKIKLCTKPEKGQSESIRLGVEATHGIPTHYLFLQADQPNLTVNDIKQLLNAATANPDKIIFPVINNQPNSPTIFPFQYRLDLLNLTGDNGGRIIRENNMENSLGIKMDTPINFTDIDTMEDFNDIV